MLPSMLLVTVLLAAEPSPDLSDAPVTVCITPNGWSVVWHPLSSKEGATAFRVLGGTDFDVCLRKIVTSAPDLLRLATAISVDAPMEDNMRAIRAIQERWKTFGVYTALDEVTATGQSGPKVAELLQKCDGLKGETRREP